MEGLIADVHGCWLVLWLSRFGMGPRPSEGWGLAERRPAAAGLG